MVSDGALWRRDRCPSDLRSNDGAYSRPAALALFGGKPVDPQLVLELPEAGGAVTDSLLQLGRLSLSGMQEKYALTQEGSTLRLTRRDEASTHILKPVVSGAAVKRAEWMPANEHLTMQLAAQVFGIRTAANGLILLPDGTPAYLTRRFDRRPDGTKWAVEDFAALAGRTPATHGADYKYAGSYFDVFGVLKTYVGAYAIEAGKLFEVLVFNYLVGNGDAHFRNFSLMETSTGGYVLAPAYDLLCTSMHVSDTPFALTEGLLPAAQRSGPIQQQFRTLATRVGLPPKPVARVFERVWGRTEAVEALVARSFLPERARRQYVQGYRRRLACLRK